LTFDSLLFLRKEGLPLKHKTAIQGGALIAVLYKRKGTTCCSFEG